MIDPKEFVRAREWRMRNSLTPQQLSDAIGFSPEMVYKHERIGHPEGAVGRPRQHEATIPKDWAWLRYKRACGDLDAELNGREKGRVFEW